MPLSSACMEMSLVYILATADSHVSLAAVSLLLMKTLNSFGTGTRIRLLGALKQLGGGQSWCIISAAILWMSFCQILEQVSVLWDSVTSPTKASTHLTGRLIKKKASPGQTPWFLHNSPAFKHHIQPEFSSSSSPCLQNVLPQIYWSVREASSDNC